MKYYDNMSKKQKTIFHLIVLGVMTLIYILVDPNDDTTLTTIASFIFTILFIIEIVIFVKYNLEKKKVKKQKYIEDNKPKFIKFYDSVPYNHENWLRVFGYKREFKVSEMANIESINNKGLKLDFKQSELLIYHNDALIGKLTDNDLIGHLNRYWDDETFQVLPVLQEVGFKSRIAKLQVNFFNQITLYDNPKVKVVVTKLIKVDETQNIIESMKNGAYLKIYKDDEINNRIYVTDNVGNTLGDVKKEIAKLVDEYFDSGYVIAKLKEVIDEVDHTDALVEFFFIQKNA